MEKNILPIKKAVLIFFVFACGYFLSCLLRAITATLSPLLTDEFNLLAGDLGLLAGGYFLGFASMQIPLGYLLDRHGPKKIVSSFLLIAIIGTAAFALAQNFAGLLISRILIGVGVSACLMGPLTGYRIWFADEYQQRGNSWMLMIASTGFVFSTLPVQILLPIFGWRWIFGGISILIFFVIILTLLFIPSWKKEVHNNNQKNAGSLSDVWKNKFFRSTIPLGLFNYGGIMAFATRTLIDTGKTTGGAGKVVILLDLNDHNASATALDADGLNGFANGCKLNIRRIRWGLVSGDISEDGSGSALIEFKGSSADTSAIRLAGSGYYDTPAINNIQ